MLFVPCSALLWKTISFVHETSDAVPSKRSALARRHTHARAFAARVRALPAKVETERAKGTEVDHNKQMLYN